MQIIRMGMMQLLPAPPGTCPECAVNHLPDQPHNAQSLHYQYRFYFDNCRWPTWKDAMAHCTQEVRDAWTRELTARGVDVEAGQISPPKTQTLAE